MPAFNLPTRITALIMAPAMLASLSGCSGPSAAEPSANKAVAAAHVAAASQIEAGRYIVKIGGCNDCHTDGYVQTNGDSPAEADWLTGSAVGYQGPWGVSYPPNLRLSFQNMTEEDFLDLAHKGEGRPPMPWPSLKRMNDDDLRAVYAYIHSLGARGQPAPAPLSPGVAPSTPVFVMEPKMPR